MPMSEPTSSPRQHDARTHAVDILYVITDLKLGGVPLHLYRLARAMRDRGWGVSVASLAPPGPVGEMIRREGIPVLDCQGRGGWDFRVIGRLADIIADTRPGLIHSFLFHGNLAARFAALSSGFPRDRVICEIQTVEVERYWHLFVDRLTHRLCRFTIGNSPSVIEHLHRHARIPLDRLRVVRGGIDADRIRLAKPIDLASLGLGATESVCAKPSPLWGRGLGEGENLRSSVRSTLTPTLSLPGRGSSHTRSDRIVLWVGRLDPVKGLDVLIRAFAPIARDRQAHLLLVGEGEQRKDLERLVGELGLQQSVRFLGPRTDVPSLLRIADVFAFPSRTEGLPNALLEAMAAGCPIVTTDVPGCRDLITNEETGILVPLGDTSALTEAIDRLLRERALAGKLGKSASRCVSEKWDLHVTFDNYEGLYRETGEKSPVDPAEPEPPDAMMVAKRNHGPRFDTAEPGPAGGSSKIVM